VAADRSLPGAAPAHAVNASDEVAEVFLRIFLEASLTRATAPNPPTPPDPEVVIQAIQTARLKDQEVSYSRSASRFPWCAISAQLHHTDGWPRYADAW